MKNKIYKIFKSFVLLSFIFSIVIIQIEPSYIYATSVENNEMLNNTFIDNYLYKQNTFHPRVKEDYFGNNFDATPIYRVNINQYDTARQNKVCLTFDSAYINDYTFRILDTLDQYNAKCTFFMTEQWALSNPTHVQEIVKRGHEIGNHTCSHPNLTLYPKETLIHEVTRCHESIKKILGGNVDMCLFRFPYGDFNHRSLTALKELGYYPIQWTLDSLDWKNEGKDEILRRFRHTDKLIPGAIILCHNGAIFTPDCLPEILELIKSKGMQCVKVSDLIYRHNFYLKDGIQYHFEDENGRMIGDDSERP